MSRVATIPAEFDVLCETCGYILNGVSPGGNCPECGTPTTGSAASLRRPPAWELGQGGKVARFVRTTIECILRSRQFFRTLSVRGNSARSRKFAWIHQWIASAAIGPAAWCHFRWFTWMGDAAPTLTDIPELLLAIVATALFLAGVTQLAARLTTFEAGYRGLRLPLSVVRRALNYHAAHYLPVALLGATTIFAYQILLSIRPQIAGLYGAVYLYTLCGAVVLSALYLFKTYWTAMRNLMYANR